jgi:hypothetical protein
MSESSLCCDMIAFDKTPTFTWLLDLALVIGAYL